MFLTTAIILIIALIPLPSVSSLAVRYVSAPSKSGQNIAKEPYRPVAIPIKNNEQFIQIGASNAYAVDVASDQPLYENNADTKRPIASITKLATAIVAARHYADDDLITVPKLPDYKPEDEIIKLQPGSKLTMHDLMAALLISSANDAADTLAISISGSREAFADEMNKVMAEWGIKDAHFSNPSGLEDADNGASAKALAQIARLSLHNQTIAALVKTPTAVIKDDKGHSYTLNSTDKLLQKGQYKGIKTGYTQAAGECFVGLTTVQGHQVITVVLGSHDRFGDTQKLVSWINSTYQWQ